MVDSHGKVVATVFAALTGTPRAGGFAVPNAVVRSQLAKASGRAVPVSTGRCAG
jgi:hypothetical protein